MLHNEARKLLISASSYGDMRCNRRITHKNNQQDTESEHIDYTVTKIPKRFT